MKKKTNKMNKAQQELYDTILQELEDLGIQIELLSISVEKGPKVIIDGEVYSHKDKELIIQTIIDVIGIDDVEDYTSIMEGIHEESLINGEIFDNIDDMEDNSYGTEDIYESIEDGEPYIPPINHIYSELSQKIRWKKKIKPGRL